MLLNDHDSSLQPHRAWPHILPNIGTIIQTAVDVNKFLAVYNDSKYLFLSTKINLKVDQFRRLYYKQGIKIKGHDSLQKFP